MMTEILLNVTNRHIETICREELQRFSRKRKGIIKFRFFSVVYRNKSLIITANTIRLFPEEKVKETLFIPTLVFVIILLRFLAG